eukprot:m.205417 g.205417  ORF g.205417 m.205417 type:complete len:151 (+) comp13747_c0_seq22:989-1441(+)
MYIIVAVGAGVQKMLMEKLQEISGWDCCETEIQARYCDSCGDQLESIELCDEEQSTLSDALDEYLREQGEAITEIISMKKKVKSIPKFDICVDGLNVGRFAAETYTPSRLHVLSNDLEKMGLNFLIFIREHVKKHAGMTCWGYFVLCVVF